MKINVLPQSIANMIAAGEVVERPASVVKELVENSIDAGATTVTIEIKRGGMSYIRVTDDGCGIEKDQVVTAFLRHATSKIHKEEDLNAIYTLGFRGEALASIASVAKVDIFTKTEDEEFGYCVSIEGGDVIDEDEAGCSDGTTIVIRDLFYNTPARMKFLKSDATETGYISDMVNKMVLSHPEVSVRLIVNGKRGITSPGDGKLISAIRAVYGRDFPPNMTEVNHEQEGFRVTGYIGNSYLSRKDRRQQVFFINGRYIASKTMSAALCEAFQNSIMIGKFPVAVLSIKLDGRFVDVNVHPTKTEVRFSDDRKVYQAVYWAVKNALTSTKYIPPVTFKEEETRSGDAFKAEAIRQKAKTVEMKESTQGDINLLRDAVYMPKQTEEKVDITNHIEKNAFFSKEDLSTLKANDSIEGYSISGKAPVATYTGPAPETKREPVAFTKDDIVKSDVITYEDDFPKIPSKPLYENKTEEAHEELPAETRADAVEAPKPVDTKEGNPNPAPKQKRHKLEADVDFTVVGQIFLTYIIVQKNNEMIIIDQHAAHERIYFEQFLEEYRTKGITSQMLLLPTTIDFEPEMFPTIEENLDFFAELGFECEVFGEHGIIVRTVPSTMTDSEIKDNIADIAELLFRGCHDIKKTLMENALHTMACKRAIKGNRYLTKVEMDDLCERVFDFDSINTCPHGRPIVISMTEYQLEKLFKRIV